MKQVPNRLSLVVIILLAKHCCSRDPVFRKIVGGMYGTSEEFPFNVLIVVYIDSNSRNCGGSLINDQWAITAALSKLWWNLQN